MNQVFSHYSSTLFEPRYGCVEPGTVVMSQRQREWMKKWEKKHLELWGDFDEGGRSSQESEAITAEADITWEVYSLFMEEMIPVEGSKVDSVVDQLQPYPPFDRGSATCMWSNRNALIEDIGCDFGYAEGDKVDSVVDLLQPYQPFASNKGKLEERKKQLEEERRKLRDDKDFCDGMERRAWEDYQEADRPYLEIREEIQRLHSSSYEQSRDKIEKKYIEEYGPDWRDDPNVSYADFDQECREERRRLEDENERLQELEKKADEILTPEYRAKVGEALERYNNAQDKQRNAKAELDKTNNEIAAIDNALAKTQ